MSVFDWPGIGSELEESSADDAPRLGRDSFRREQCHLLFFLNGAEIQRYLTFSAAITNKIVNLGIYL